MLNEKIIREFTRLVSFVKTETDEFIKNKDIKKATINKFRLKQIKYVLSILKSYPNKITLKNYMELQELDGIGMHSIKRIREILETGKLSELGDYREPSFKKEKIIAEFESIIGVGRSKALEFYNKGILSIKDLQKKIKKGEIMISDKVKLGLKYYGKFEEKIPRNETDQINKILKKIIHRLNKKYKLDETNKYIYQICGSYRRKKITSNDIDVLVSKIGTKDNDKLDINHLERIIFVLKEKLKENDNKPLLVDDITDKSYETKYMGFVKYKDNPVRRMDIRFIPYESYFSALLYFTGSVELNKKMRLIARGKKLKLSEYGLFKKDGTKIKINSEKDFFKALDIEYIEPEYR